MKLKVHLTFDGCCEEAMNFYQSVLGGQIPIKLTREKDQNEMPSPKEKILYTVLKTDSFDLAAEDILAERDFNIGNNTNLVLNFDDLDHCRQVFQSLSQGGSVTEPFQKTFFSEGIGEFTDRYGVSWIIMMNGGCNA